MTLKEQIEFATKLYDLHMNELNRSGATTEQKMEAVTMAQKFNDVRQSLMRLENIRTIANASESGT